MDLEQLATILDHIVKVIPMSNPWFMAGAAVLAVAAIALRVYNSKYRKAKPALEQTAEADPLAQYLPQDLQKPVDKSDLSK